MMILLPRPLSTSQAPEPLTLWAEILTTPLPVSLTLLPATSPLTPIPPSRVTSQA